MHILVVDDEESTRFYLKRIMTKKFGYHVSQASNGSEALDSIQENRPDIVFLDISMPVMDGIECLRQIRRDSNTEDLDVVIMTAHNDKNTVAEFLQLGIQDYILKPFGYYKTFERLQEILSNLKNKEKKEPSQEEEAIGDVKRQKVIITDSDINFRTFFKQLLGNRFRIFETKDEDSCIKNALNTNPDIIIICDNLKSLNEPKLIKSLRESDTDNKLKIYLCKDINNSGNLNSEYYDGVLQKSFLTDIFMREFSTKVLKYSSLYDMIADLFESYIKYDVISAIKHTLKLSNGYALEFPPAFENQDLLNKILSKSELIANDDGFLLNIGIVGNETDSIKLVKMLSEKPNQISSNENANLNYLCQSVASRIKLATERYGIKSSMESPAIKNIVLNTFQSYWKMIIPIKAADTNFFVGINLEKTS